MSYLIVRNIRFISSNFGRLLLFLFSFVILDVELGQLVRKLVLLVFLLFNFLGGGRGIGWLITFSIFEALDQLLMPTAVLADFLDDFVAFALQEESIGPRLSIFKVVARFLRVLHVDEHLRRLDLVDD